MKSQIFVPETITVGYQNRTDTYTKKLAYVIYTDNKGVLRKEASWQSWRDKKIDSTVFDNKPTDGFVLNKKVGGDRYGWNPRQTYTRVYDPRGFEFEITIPNLLYILENTNSIKGKGLEGNFVYGWDGKDLVLLPEAAPELKSIIDFTELQSAKIGVKDLEIGREYLTKRQESLIYLGKFKFYNRNHAPYNSYRDKYDVPMITYSLIDRYVFMQDKNVVALSGLSTLAKKATNECCSNYADLMDIWTKTHESSKPKELIKKDIIIPQLNLTERIDAYANRQSIEGFIEQSKNVFKHVYVNINCQHTYDHDLKKYKIKDTHYSIQLSEIVKYDEEKLEITRFNSKYDYIKKGALSAGNDYWGPDLELTRSDIDTFFATRNFQTVEVLFENGVKKNLRSIY